MKGRRQGSTPGARSVGPVTPVPGHRARTRRRRGPPDPRRHVARMGSILDRPRSGLDGLPVRVDAVGVAGRLVVLEEVERQPVVGHLDGAVVTSDRAELAGHAGPAGRCRAGGHGQRRPGVDATGQAGALAAVLDVLGEDVDASSRWPRPARCRCSRRAWPRRWRRRPRPMPAPRGAGGRSRSLRGRGDGCRCDGCRRLGCDRRRGAGAAAAGDERHDDQWREREGPETHR